MAKVIRITDDSHKAIKHLCIDNDATLSQMILKLCKFWNEKGAKNDTPTTEPQQ